MISSVSIKSDGRLLLKITYKDGVYEITRRQDMTHLTVDCRNEKGKKIKFDMEAK
jgi:hypothetical protein